MQTKVMIVGEFLDTEAAHEGKALSDGAQGLIQGLIRQAAIPEDEVYFTNVINSRPASGDWKNFCGRKPDALFPEHRPIAPGQYLHARYAKEIERFEAELADERPNVVIAMGNLALWALSRKTGIKKYRGSPLPSIHQEPFKVIPTWAISTIFAQWETRIVALADFTKAGKEKDFPEIQRPQRFIYMSPDLDDIQEIYHRIFVGQPFLSCDIETKGGTITEVGFGTANGAHCLVIPFWDRLADDGNYWEHKWQEKRAWTWVRRLCAEFYLIGQNFSYDMQYLWRTVGIPCPWVLDDTMLMQHSLQPELEKSLGFLGSVYTQEPAWKFMRADHSTLKRGDE